MKNCDNCIHYQICDKQKIANHRVSKSVCKHYKDESFIFDLIPLSINTHLWKISSFHKDGPKATEFIVKNFRTVGEKHDIQVEVQAVGTPLRYWVAYHDFFKTKEEAEKELERRKREKGNV